MVNFNSISALNTYNLLNAVNSQAAIGKNADGKIFVPTDFFTPEKAANPTGLSLMERLDNIDKMAKDRNGSQGLMYTKADTSSANKREQRSPEPQVGVKLKNLYA